MNRAIKVTRLHLNKPQMYILVPLSILGIVMVISAIIALAIQRGGVDTGTAEYIDGARYNSAIVWSLPGFLVYYGVQAVATTYPFGLALGTTRRNFVLGTTIANALQAALLTVILLGLLGLELLTNHWFFNIYVLDVHMLGSGNPLVLAVTAFLGIMFCLTLGGFFGAVWVRFGAKGPTIVGLVLGLGLAIALLVLAPHLTEIFAQITSAMVAGIALLIIVLALIGTWLAMRRASVR